MIISLLKAFLQKSFHKQKNKLHLHSPIGGAIAQLVEQRTENPCVAGSIPAGTTFKPFSFKMRGVFICIRFFYLYLMLI